MKTRRWWKFALMAFLSLIVLRMFAYESYWTDSGNMVPTLLRGDHIIVNDLSYGLRVPFTHLKLLQSAPSRGDVIAFDVVATPAQRSTGSAIGRVVGLPGDVVDVFGGRLTINRQPVLTKTVGDVELNSDGDPAAVDRARVTDMYDLFEERLGDHLHQTVSVMGARQIPPASGRFTVQAGHVFVLGDSRDHSLDSRFPPERGGYGEVPIGRIRGRVVAVLLSRREQQFRRDRWFRWIE